MYRKLIEFYQKNCQEIKQKFFQSTQKEIDSMAKANRSELEAFMTSIVNEDNEIDSIFAFDSNGLKLVGSNGVGAQREAKTLEERSEHIAGSLTRIITVKKAITEFGQASMRGELQYAIFQMDNGILLIYYLEINNQETNVAFISSTPEGLGLMLRHAQKNIDKIKEMLRDIL